MSQETTLLYTRACNGNESALGFLAIWNRYVNGIDDIIDAKADKVDRNAEFILGVFATACTLFSHPFYQQNVIRLQPVVLLVTSAYADSVQWERSPKIGPRTISDVLSISSNEMCFAVALICGGYDLLRSISSDLREIGWNNHHDQDGKRD